MVQANVMQMCYTHPGLAANMITNPGESQQRQPILPVLKLYKLLMLQSCTTSLDHAVSILHLPSCLCLWGNGTALPSSLAFAAMQST